MQECAGILSGCNTCSRRGIAVPAASGASLEQDTAVAGMAVSLDNYYASSQTPEADIMDYIRYIVASAQEKKIIPVFTVMRRRKKMVPLYLELVWCQRMPAKRKKDLSV